MMRRPAGNRRWTVLLCLAGFTAAAAWLRLSRLDLPVLTIDEAFTWRVCQDPPSEMLRRVAADTHPPGHFLLEKAWIACFGDSAFCIRSLSALAGVLCVPFTFVMCRATARPASSSAAALDAPALFAAALVAFGPGPIDAARSARMYVWAMLLSVVSAWLLLRALRGDARRMRDWFFYAAAATSLLYMHNFAWFTLAAQGTYAIADLLSRAVLRRRAGSWTALNGFLLAYSITLLFYSPWLPEFLAQSGRVLDGFWLTAPSGSRLWSMFCSWLALGGKLSYWERWPVLAAAGTFILWTLARRHREGVFFLWQAAVPWMAASYITFTVGRPIFRAPYFGCAQMALAGVVSTALCRLPSRVEKTMLCVCLGALVVRGVAEVVRDAPAGESALAVLGRHVAARHSPGDAVLVMDIAALNRLRFYLAQAGLRQVDARCFTVPFEGSGQAAQLASLHCGDIVWRTDAASARVERIWCVDSATPPTDGYVEVGSWSFRGGPGNGADRAWLALWASERIVVTP